MEQKETGPGTETSSALSQPKGPEWVEPKLAYLEPKVTEHGELRDVTGFLGTFSP
jgi:hypothetical protein